MEPQKIYKITNDINQKVYVGQTGKTLEDRFSRHCSESTWKNTKRMPIIFAIKKYGKQHFKIELLEELPIGTPQSIVDSKETEWGYKLNAFSPSGYNLKFGNGRRQWSDEVKKKIGDSQRGKYVSAETRSKLSKSHMGNKLSDATKKKLSVRWKGIRPNKLAQQNSIAASSKTYALIDPSGTPKEIHNMAQFCRENGYNKGQMCLLVNGKKDSYRGWKKA